jgi:hypothetical protein
LLFGSPRERLELEAGAKPHMIAQAWSGGERLLLG